MPTASKTVRREQSRLRKQRQRDRERERRRLAAQAAAEAQERRDEDVVPKAQRTAVTGIDGAVLRAPRLVRDGVGFRRTDPLAWIATEVDGGSRMFTQAHYAVARRLRHAWDAVSGGVGLGASDWDKIRSPQGTAPWAPAGHSALVDQVAQRIELDTASAFLGALWPAVRDMVLIGTSVAAWAASAGVDRRAAPGYLRAALDRLVERYAEQTDRPRMVAIRTIAPGRDTYTLDGGAEV